MLNASLYVSEAIERLDRKRDKLLETYYGLSEDARNTAYGENLLKNIDSTGTALHYLHKASDCLPEDEK